MTRDEREAFLRRFNAPKTPPETRHAHKQQSTEWLRYRHWMRYCRKKFERERPDIAASGPQFQTSAQLIEEYAGTFAMEEFSYDREMMLAENAAKLNARFDF